MNSATPSMVVAPASGDDGRLGWSGVGLPRLDTVSGRTVQFAGGDLPRVVRLRAARRLGAPVAVVGAIVAPTAALDLLPLGVSRPRRSGRAAVAAQPGDDGRRPGEVRTDRETLELRDGLSPTLFVI